jgi:hypothetical protein
MSLGRWWNKKCVGYVGKVAPRKKYTKIRKKLCYIEYMHDIAE